LEEITEMHLSQIRDCFSSICQFFSYCKTTSTPKQTPQASGSQNQAQTPLGQINLNTNSMSTTPTQSEKHNKHPSISDLKSQQQRPAGSTYKSQLSQNSFYNYPLGNTNSDRSGSNQNYGYKYENGSLAGQGNFSTSANKPLNRMNSYAGADNVTKKKPCGNTSVAELLNRSKTTTFN
jgi:hypothetical protein